VINLIRLALLEQSNEDLREEVPKPTRIRQSADRAAFPCQLGAAHTQFRDLREHLELGAPNLEYLLQSQVLRDAGPVVVSDLWLWQMKSEREEFERKSRRVLQILQQKDQVISEVEAENSQLQCNLLAWYEQSRYFFVKHLVTLYFVVKRRSAKTGATAACSTASSNEKLTAECAELKRRLSEHSNTADANQTSDRQWRERVQQTRSTTPKATTRRCWPRATGK